MSDKRAWFDVKVYLSKEEYDELRPTYEFDGFENKAEAISEAELWPEAYQAVVVARSEDNERESGECVFMLKKI
jgi:hypothetical protein